VVPSAGVPGLAGLGCVKRGGSPQRPQPNSFLLVQVSSLWRICAVPCWNDQVLFQNCRWRLLSLGKAGAGGQIAPP
jgi:hypothetical protein